jgi:hypothetical protein
MEEVEAVTAKGEGVWGNQKYRLTLKTRIQTYHDSLAKFEKQISKYSFTFQSDSIADSRFFWSEEERRAFLAQSFTELRTAEIAEPARQWTKLTSKVESVVGCKLTAVAFVMDYLQLDLPPYGFFVYNWPLLYVDAKCTQFSDEDYRKVLHTFVGKQVSRFDEYLDKGITLEFDDGSSLGVPLKVGADFSSPEVAEFWGPGVNGYVWQTGEPPFD